MRKGLIAAGLAALVAVAVVTAAVAKPAAQTTPAQIAACTNVSLGFLGPLTGPAGFLGQEQLSWLRFGVQKYNKENGTRFKVVLGDTQLKAPVARTQARRFIGQQQHPGRDRRLGEPGRARERKAVCERRPRLRLRVGDGDRPHEGPSVPDVLPGRAERSASRDPRS